MRSLEGLMDLTGKQALLVGGAGHIGRAAAEALVELGACVAIADVSLQACEQRARLLSAHGRGSAWPLALNLSDEQNSRDAIQTVLAKQKRLDILIHCAAMGGQATGYTVPFAEQTLSAWDQALRINLSSAFVLVQEASESLASSRCGSVILFSSIYGMVGPDMRLYENTPMGNPAAYGAAKGGLLQLTRYLATTLAPAIRVNAISPGGVWRNQPDPFVDRYVSRTPLARMAKEEDLKGAIAFLASDLSGYVTGQNLAVDGGWTAW